MVMRLRGMPHLLTLTMVGFAGFSLLLPTSPLWALEAGADEFVSGLVTTVFMAVTVLTQLVVNRLLRTIGWTRVLALGLIMLGVPALLQAIGPEIWLIMLTTAARGVGFGIITVCGATATSLLAPAAVRGRAIGMYGLGIAVPQVFLMPASPWLADVLGLPATLALGVIPVIGLVWVAPLGRAITDAEQFEATVPQTAAARADEVPDVSMVTDARDLPGTSVTAPTPPARDGMRAFLGRVWVPVIALVVTTAAAGAFQTFAPQLVDSTVIAVAALFALTLLSALARLVFGSLTDRWGPGVFIWALLILGAIGLGVVALSLSSIIDPAAAGGAVLLIVGAALIGIAYGGVQTTTLVRAFNDGGEAHRHNSSVAWNVGFDVGTASGSMLVGAVAMASNFSTGFVTMAVLVVLTAVVVVVRDRTVRRAPTVTTSGE